MRCSQAHHFPRVLAVFQASTRRHGMFFLAQPSEMPPGTKSGKVGARLTQRISKIFLNSRHLIFRHSIFGELK